MTEREIYRAINEYRVMLIGLHRDFMLERDPEIKVLIKENIDLALDNIRLCKRLLSLKRELGEI